MTTYVTVPGASSSVIVNPYNTPFNLQIAQEIANVLSVAQTNSKLLVSSFTPGSALPAVPMGEVGEIAVTVATGSISVPSGYGFTAIGPTLEGGTGVTGPFTVSGGGSLFVGNQNTTYYGAAAAGSVSIAAGDGTDLIGLAPGSTYNVGLGNGNDTVYANGSGTVTGGSGANLFFADSSNGQNQINSYGAADTIVAGHGSVSVATHGASPLVYGGAGQLVYIGSAGTAGNPTIAGGSGTETLFGGAGQNITYTDGSNTTQGANIIASGSGNETLNAGLAKYGVQMAIGSGSVDIIGSAAGDTIFGGSGAATVTTNGGSDLFVFGNVAGHTGGTDLITDFNTTKDTINLTGVSVTSSTGAAGSSIVTLSDGTKITFSGVTDPSKINFT
jgi:Ca2+-binding RTX toxin-like protein